MGPLSLDSLRCRVTSVLVTGPPDNHFDVGLLPPALILLYLGSSSVNSTLPVFQFSECVCMSRLLYHPYFHFHLLHLFIVAISIHIIGLMTSSYPHPRHLISVCLIFLAILTIVVFVLYVFEPYIFPHISDCSIHYTVSHFLLVILYYVLII